MGIDDGIVDELTEHSDGLTHGGCMTGAERVADAETHAVMLCEVDVHWCVCWTLTL